MTTISVELKQLIHNLKQEGFQGEIEVDYAERIVAATDNSIYQVVPQAILYPRVEEDINRAMTCVYAHRHHGFNLCARGAATGTNGQSLSTSLILDCSRHLNQILDFDPKRQEITIQPGVVLDQLNEYLAEYELFFPIDISTSSRATLGGMVATDASGKGSLIYGKTSHYLQQIDLVLADGSDYRAAAHKLDHINPEIPDFILPIAFELEQQREEIDRVFPKMHRGLTGYNLQQSIEEPNIFNTCFLVAGSEGTLGISKRITLKVIKKPTHRRLTVIFYQNFLQALDHVSSLMECAPAAIEMLDDKIIRLAQSDSVWFSIKNMLATQTDNPEIQAINYVEHVGYSDKELQQKQQILLDIIADNGKAHGVVFSQTEHEADKITALWNLRKRAVGLLGKLQGSKRGIAFVEDTAVPTENLARYIKGFRQILDEAGLDYGMYGHADAGVLHVRPLLDMLQQKDRDLIRLLSDQVANLALKNKGVLWGEHGRGFRGEYTPLFFGEKLYSLLTKIKHYFDPYNILNPGKLATPDVNLPITPLDQVTMKGTFDQQISLRARQDYSSALACNGNGTCHSWKLSDTMCPSYKATGNKAYSPKGRAAMLREWIRLKDNPSQGSEMASLETSLKKSLQHCLSCKSCTSTCPLNVDIPEMKSRFLEHMGQQNSAIIKNQLIQHFENLISIGSRLPKIHNLFLKSSLISKLIQYLSGLNRIPWFAPIPLPKGVGLAHQHLDTIRSSDKAIILLRDNYLNSFDGKTINAACLLLQRMGYDVYITQPIHNGKLLYVKGFRNRFKQQSKQVIDSMLTMANCGKPLLSLETMSRLMFEQEYPLILGQSVNIQVQSIEDFLVSNLAKLQRLPLSDQAAVTLLPHCMEQTQSQESSQQWQQVYKALDIDCRVINAGCCGMSGLFGHEIENNALSDAIFNLQWRSIAEHTQSSRLLANGYSCRSQLKNKDFQTVHPVEDLCSRLVRPH